MSTRPRVLITNDDGITAPGIRWLATAAVEHGLDVVVAAPQTEASGYSAAMIAVEKGNRIVVERQRLAGLDDTDAYGVGASPAFIVVLALRGAFGPPPDLVLSGINRGANAGHAVLHSGTVGAALTAGADGVRAIAVSLDVLSPTARSAAGDHLSEELAGDFLTSAELDSANDDKRYWREAASITIDLVSHLRGAPEGTVLNVNVPDLPAERQKGVRRAGLAKFGQVQMSLAEAGEGFVQITAEESGARLEPGSDLACLAEGYASVTPIRTVQEAPEIPLPL